MKAQQQTDIAIIGMAGLFPKAENIAAYWSNILNRVDAIDEPLADWGAARYYDPSLAATDAEVSKGGFLEQAKVYTQHGGFLKELSRFNPAAFGIMPVSTASGEPDQFHALELAKAALQDAGLSEHDYQPEATGIILGHGIHPNRASINGVQHGVVADQMLDILAAVLPLDAGRRQELRQLLKAKLLPMDVDSIPGLVPNMMTGRIANRLNLMGPNYIIDAACASSLIAVENAMQELQRGRADLMLAGGINTSTPPLVHMVFCELGALSRSSRIRPFDAEADGTLLGEGGGVLVLRRLEDALRDGQRVYAVLKSIGQASDGRAKGLMAPRLEGEVLAMRRAYQQAQIDPQTIGLIEAHGTGIPLGDQTEIQALGQLLGQRRGRIPSVALGSVKSMIGHCIPAAGIASLIKISLALHHKILPPTLCANVNPALGLEQTPLYINTETRSWVQGGRLPRRAGINAFGFGGINSHALLEEAPTEQAEPLSAFLGRPWRTGSELLVLAQPDRAALLAQIEQLQARLRAEPILSLATLAAELWQQRGTGHERLAVVAKDGTELAAKLKAVVGKLAEPNRDHLQTREGVYFNAKPFSGRVAFLFPGENSQYPNMLCDLAVGFPAVRTWFDFLEHLYADERELAPRQAIFPPPTGLSADDQANLLAELRGMELGSESVFAADQALYALLTAFGVQADAMLGHSTGENAALVASGTIKLDRQGIGNNIRRMNELYRALENDGAIPDGRLLSVGAVTLERVQAVLAADPRLRLTMDNCSNQFILFGPEEAISAAHQQFKLQGGLCSVLPLDRGYHTPLMAPMRDAFQQLFEQIAFAPASVTLYSCVTAEPFPQDPAAIRDTAAAQYVQPVLFRQSIQNLYRDGVRLFIEVGPDSHLTAFVRDILRNQPHVAVATDDLRRGSAVQFRHLLGVLFTQGLALNLDLLYGGTAKPTSKPAPYLSTAIPVIELQEEEAAQLRQWAGGSPTSSVSDSLSLLAAQAAEQATQAATDANLQPTVKHAVVPQIGMARHQTALTDHFGLMQDFLRQQEQVMAAWLQRRRVR